MAVLSWLNLMLSALISQPEVTWQSAQLIFRSLPCGFGVINFTEVNKTNVPMINDSFRI
jgi:hypothetical protein